MTTDPNVDAIERADLAPEMDGWLRQVNDQVDPRLDRDAPRWRQSAQQGAARAALFGLMLGRLAEDYPHTRDVLSTVAEAHPSFANLVAGSRLETLRQIATEPARVGAWIAPLVDAEPGDLRTVLD